MDLCAWRSKSRNSEAEQAWNSLKFSRIKSFLFHPQKIVSNSRQPAAIRFAKFPATRDNLAIHAPNQGEGAARPFLPPPPILRFLCDLLFNQSQTQHRPTPQPQTLCSLCYLLFKFKPKPLSPKCHVHNRDNLAIHALNQGEGAARPYVPPPPGQAAPVPWTSHGRVSTRISDATFQSMGP